MIDFHCHLDLLPEPFVAARMCVERHVDVLSVTTSPTAWRGTLRLADHSDGRIRTALGLHPEIAPERIHELSLFDQLLPEARWIGEIGLDRTPTTSTAAWRAQVSVFEHILEACARTGGRVISVHSRGAAGDVLTRLEQRPDAGVVILHWFSGSLAELERAVDLGCWFSLGLPTLQGRRAPQILSRIPADRLLTETDAPFVHARGRVVTPWDTEEALGLLARFRNDGVDEVSASLRDNLRQIDAHADQLFGST